MGDMPITGWGSDLAKWDAGGIMPFPIGLAGLAFAVLYFLVRANNTAKDVREPGRDTKGSQRRIGSGLQRLIGTPLERVNDQRLGAVILMIQLVRTDSPVTAQAKTQFRELMETRSGAEYFRHV